MQYLTVRDVADIFHRSEKTIRRWIEENRQIQFDSRIYIPQRDPGGCWLFVVHVVNENRQAPIGLTKRRRILSEGIIDPERR